MKKYMIAWSICIMMFLSGYSISGHKQDNLTVNTPPNTQKNDSTRVSAGDTTLIVNPSLVFVPDPNDSLQFVTSLPSVTVQLPDLIPPSPNAAGLGKFVAVPVSLYTGTPQISIPVFTVQEGDLILSIALNYNASGIKVVEIASWVGLGWSLEAGGVITRAIHGKPDESNMGFLNVLYPTDNDDYVALLPHFTGSIDNQPDMFYYNFAGHSGRFVFDKNGIIHTIPKKNIKIERTGVIYNYGNNHISKWCITTEDGVKYSFDEYEMSESISDVANEGFQFSSISTSCYSVNTWYLTEIESPQGHKITLNYTNVNLQYSMFSSLNSIPKLSGGCSNVEGIPKYTALRQEIASKRLNSINFSNGSVQFVAHTKDRADLIGDKALQKILIKNSTSTIRQFEFNYSILEGVSLISYETITVTGNNILSYPVGFTVPMKRRLILDKVVETDASCNHVNDGYRFEYLHDIGLPNRCYFKSDHWGYANGAELSNPALDLDVNVTNGVYVIVGKNPDLNYCRQGTMNKIHYPTKGYATFEYGLNKYRTNPDTPENYYEVNKFLSFPMSHFKYNLNQYDYTMVTIGGIQQKHYYQEFTVGGTHNSVMITATTTNMPNNAGVFGYYIVNMNNPNVRIWEESNNKTTYKTLSKGTYRIYHFPYQAALDDPSHPLNQVLYEATLKWTELHKIEGSVKEAGGLRVEKTIIYDPVTQQSLVKKYQYENEELMLSGFLVNSPVYTRDYEELHSMPGGGVQHCNFKILSANSMYPLVTTMGSYVGYKQVMEVHLDILGNRLGAIEHEYTAPDQYPDILPTGHILQNTVPYPPADNRDWCRGKLIRQTTYSNLTPVKEIRNVYSLTTAPVSKGYKAMCVKMDFHTNIHSYIATFYGISSGNLLLTETREKELRSGAWVESVTKYQYGATFELPVHISQTSSSAGEEHRYFAYPADYAAGSGFVDQLMSRNIIYKPIEEVSAREDGQGNILITAGTFTQYNNDGTVETVNLLETENPIAKSSFKFSARATGTLPPQGTKTILQKDSRYKEHLMCEYDNKNLAAYTLRGLPAVFLWGYKGQYPIAKIENATYTEVKTALGSLTPKTISDRAKPLSSDWTAINNLRDAFSLKNALITTYSYKPLVGVELETDPAKRKITFDYDTFGRLTRIKDDEDKIVKEYKYNYAQ